MIPALPTALLTAALLAQAGNVEGLYEAIATGSRPQVDQAISKLKHVGATRERMFEIARMLRDSRQPVRENAAYVFSVLPDASFGQDLTAALQDQSDVVRSHCAIALGKAKVGASAPALVRLLGDVSPVVRREAVKSLGLLASKPAASKVAAALQDSSPDVRISAILALGQIGDKSVEKRLVPLLKDSSETTRLAATKSLAQLGNAEGREVVEAMLASQEPAERIDGIRLLEGVKAPWARDALLQLMKAPEVGVAIAAARGLASIGDGRGVEWLVHAAPRVDAEVTLKVERALEDLHVTAEDRKKILARKPSPELVLPHLEKGP